MEHRDPPPLIPDEIEQKLWAERQALRPLRIYLRDIDDEMIRAWNVVFHDERLMTAARAKGYNLEIDIRKADITSAQSYETTDDAPGSSNKASPVIVDALVSPANSLGDMHGGIDGVYLRIFGARLEKDVLKQVREKHHGLLPLGKATIVSMQRYSDMFRFLISSPTMVVPGVPDLLAPYLSFKAALEMMETCNKSFGDKRKPIRSIACPGLGTGVGGIPHFRCALQMRAALDSFFGFAFHSRALKEQRELYVLLTTIKKPFKIDTLYQP